MALIVAIRASGFNYLQIDVSFTAVTRVQIPSGTPSPFRSLRTIAESFVGTKRHNSKWIPAIVSAESPVFPLVCCVFHRHKKAQPRLDAFQPAVAPDARNSLMIITLSFTFVKRDCLRIWYHGVLSANRKRRFEQGHARYLYAGSQSSQT